MLPDYSPYVLPTIDFVGGESQDLAFPVFYHDSHRPYSLSGSTSSFSIVSFRNKNGAPIFTKPMKPRLNSTGTAYNVLTLTLQPEDTLDLDGKYIYQIQIRDIDGGVEIPKRGILYITNNIDKNFIRQ